MQQIVSTTPQTTAQSQQAEVKTDAQQAADIVNSGQTTGITTESPKPEPAKPADDFSEKFAALTREQKKIWEEKQKLKAIQAEVEAYKKRLDLKKQNPYQFLKEEGLELNQILELAAKDGEPPSAEDKILELEKKLEARIKAEQEKEERERLAREQEAIDKFKVNLENHIKTKADEYELINAQGAYGVVFEVIAQHYDKTLQETGTAEILDMDKAAQMVETHLFNELQRLKGVKKVSALFGQQIEAATEPAKTQGPSATLSGSVVPQQTAPRPKPRTIEESKAEAAKLLRWT